MSEEFDVIVVGAGNAAMCAAMSAHENGAKVCILERANEDEAGGNSRYTAGALRFAHNGLQDIMTLVDLTDDEKENNDFGTYTTDQFFDDMFRVTQYRTDPELCEILVTKSLETTKWMHSKGIRFMPMYGRQAFKVDGKMKFWGGLALEFWGGGPGIWEMESKIVGDLGIPIKFEHRAVGLLYDDEKVYGVKVKHKGKVFDMKAKSVVLAAGGFESNSDWRTRYLGPGWDLVKVRGTRHNMGEGIKMALDIGAMPYGNWSGCHAVGWDLNAPEFGDLAVGDTSKSTVTRSASWSTPPASASSTKAPISGTTPMRNTAR